MRQYNDAELNKIRNKMLILRSKHINIAIQNCKQVKRGGSICESCSKIGFLKYANSELDILIKKYNFNVHDMDAYVKVVEKEGMAENKRANIKEMKKLDEIEELFNQKYSIN